MKNKAQGLPINIIVMLIVGIILFGLGFALFGKMFSAGDDIVSDLNTEIKSDISRIACDGQLWVCSNPIKMSSTDEKSQIFVVNRGDETHDISISIEGSSVSGSGGRYEVSNDCGTLEVYTTTASHSTPSGQQSVFPIRVIQADNMKSSCTFTFVAAISGVSTDGIDEKDLKTPVIVTLR